MNKIALEIVGLSYSHSQSGAYAFILGDKNSQRRLPIIIGSAEAQSIALGMESVAGSRPLTHDLFKNFADSYNIKLKEIIINRFLEGVFYASLICELDGTLSRIDARPSDAISLAVRFKCPMYTTDAVMEDAGIILDDDFEEDNELAGSETDDDDLIESIEKEQGLSFYQTEELQELLQEAIENEDYNKAAEIRDEIKKREF